MAPTENDLKVGDLIEISRGLYRHWAVYVGDGFVVHLALTSNVQGSSADSLMSVPNEKALVKKEKLRDVVGNDKWEINNSLDEKNKPRPAEDIARDACTRVGETLPYNVIKKNCEHFANDLRYGKAKSMQVWSAGAALAIGGTALLGSPLVFMSAIVIGAALVMDRKNR